MEKELVRLGLTEGEARTYLALLKLGSSRVGRIIKEARVSPSKIYPVLDRLLEKGLAGFIIRNKTRYFHGVPPTRLHEFLDKKESVLQENRALLNDIMPRLQKNILPGQVQEAEVFLGFKGVRTAYELLLEDHDKKDDLLFFYIHEATDFKKVDLFYKQAFKYYKKIGLKLKGISTIDYKNASHFENPPSFIKLRLVDFPLPSMVDIYKDKVLFTSWKEKPVAYLVHSKEIADNFRKYFEAVWKVAR